MPSNLQGTMSGNLAEDRSPTSMAERAVEQMVNSTSMVALCLRGALLYLLPGLHRPSGMCNSNPRSLHLVATFNKATSLQTQ